MIRIAQECKTPATAFDISEWPEFLALCKRLGVDMTRPYSDLAILVDWQYDIVKIELTQRGSDATK